MQVYCNKKAVISIAHDLVLHARTKHVKVDKHFVKEKIDGRMICMSYVSTTKQVIGDLTKKLHKKQFDYLIEKLTMKDIFKSSCQGVL